MRHIVIGTAGHIDHGKSALVRALTGIDPDRLKEEKLRGITIDLGFAHLERGDLTLAFVDVPGHERFVKNMLAGATGIDIVLLVVAADESVMPQTREHFDICRLLGIRGGVVALTKTDLVDADTLELVRLEVGELVGGSFLEGAPVVAVSARTGQGLEALVEALSAAARAVPSRRERGVFRLPIDRVFSVRGFGTVVTGTVAAGRVRVDDELVLLPSGRRVKVRGLQGHGRALQEAAAGQRAAINLAGVETGEIERGETLTVPGAFEPTRRLDAVVELVPSARPLRHGARVRFHAGTSERLGRVAISRVVAGPGSAGEPAAEIPPGGRAHVRIRLELPAVLTRGDRFILRAYSPPVTVGGGVVLDPHPPRGAIRTEAGRRRFARLDPGDGPIDATDVVARAAVEMIAERGAAGVSAAALGHRLGLEAEALDCLTQRLARDGLVCPVGDGFVSADVVARAGRALVEQVAEYHRAQPLSDGLPREEAREKLFARAHPALFETVVRRLGEAGQIAGRERLALPTHRVAASDEEERLRARVEEVFRRAGLRPPDLAAAAAELGVAPAEIDRAARWLLRAKQLVKVDTLFFHAAALDALKREVRGLKAGGADATLDVASFKERFGVTRKYAIPLLEYLDRERVTRRAGEVRVVL
jgi:selenocysteine-specific elongation factor